MVKYGKEYRQLQLDEWKKYYLNYKTLKKKIKEMKRILIKDLKVKDKNIRPSLLTTPLLPEESNENESLSVLYKEKNGEYLKEFIDLLSNEYQKSYSFFIGIEKALIRKVNTHLYTQTSYSTYSLMELSKEMKSLSLTIYLAKSLNAFVNDIMMAIKKILKKFDKNFAHIYGIITPHLILQLLSKKNSELDYMLEFKLIDEISIIAENSCNELKKYFDQTDNSGNNNDDVEYRNTFMTKYNETLKYIKDIDELIYFKTQYKDWVDYVRGKKGIKKSSKYFENDIFNPILSASYHKDNLLDKFLSTNDAFNEIKIFQKPLTLMNKRNIILILTQVFFYNTLLTCIFPVLYYYIYICGLENDNKIDQFWLLNMLLFLTVGATYLSQYLSIFFTYNYISIKNIKVSYILSYIFLFIGSVLYIASILSNYRKEIVTSGESITDSGHYKTRVLILGIARFIIGLGSNSMMGKKYITLYCPKYFLPVVSKIYLIIELSGFILGPCITALFSFLKIGNFYCLFNCVGYYGAFGSLVLFFINQFLFTSPQNQNFFAVLNQTRDDINASTTQVGQSNFEDEDEEDKEFYKLQKEANERKSAGLEPTKSDEVHIEINDNQPNNKDINTKTESNPNFNDEKEKDADDTNYNKIMDNARDSIGQNEIAENYYYNVDTGRYSDVDLSNEQRDTIKEIEAKLYEYQEKSNFTYIDMIPRTLDDIILKEQKTFGYMNRNFIIILFLLFFNNFIKENLIIYSAYYILFIIYNKGDSVNVPDGYGNVLEFSQTKKGSIQIISLIVAGELLLQICSVIFIMPFYKINLIFKKNLMIFMIASIVFMIPLSIPYLDYIYVYAPLVSLSALTHKVIEVMLSCYLVYLIPPQWKYAHIRASSLPIYFMNFAKLCACLLCFVCYNGPTDLNHNLDDLTTVFKFDHHLLISITFIVYGIFGIIIYKSANFRVKALARILRKKAME